MRFAAFIYSHVHTFSIWVISKVLHAIPGVSGIYEILVPRSGQIFQIIAQEDVVIIVATKRITIYTVGEVKIGIFF